MVTLVKNLRLKLDENISGKAHVGDLISKCAGRISFLYRNSAFLNLKCRRILCSALIQPYLDYCCSSWYSSITKILRGRLDVIQRRMVRFIFSMDHMHHVGTKDLLNLGWLSIPDRVKYFKLVHVFKIKHGIAPDYLCDSFVPITQTHSHNTRGSGLDFAITRDLSSSRTSFAYTAIKHWNSLPLFLKNIQSESTFRIKLKEYLQSNY